MAVGTEKSLSDHGSCILRAILCVLVLGTCASQGASSRTDGLGVEESSVPTRLKKIWANNLPFAERARTIRDLRGRSLTDAELASLLRFLRQPPSRKPSIDPKERAALKNDTAVLLMSHNPPPSGFGAHLIEMASDPELSREWRDYCLQFLGEWLPRETDQETRKQILGVFRRAAADHRTVSAGTALLAMLRNIESGGCDRNEVAGLALAVVTDPKATDGAVVTAFQVCAKLGLATCLEAARDVAISNRSIPVRSSAIAALGYLGNSEDETPIKRLTRSPDSRLRSAARGALQRLNKP